MDLPSCSEVSRSQVATIDELNTVDLPQPRKVSEKHRKKKKDLPMYSVIYQRDVLFQTSYATLSRRFQDSPHRHSAPRASSIWTALSKPQRSGFPRTSIKASSNCFEVGFFAPFASNRATVFWCPNRSAFNSALLSSALTSAPRSNSISTAFLGRW
jgi:hypothetical protein